MLFSSALVLASAVAVTGLSLQQGGQIPLNPPHIIDHEDAERVQYLVEFGPGETEWISENQKWALRRVRLRSCLSAGFSR
jgi:hypothetical protein